MITSTGYKVDNAIFGSFPMIAVYNWHYLKEIKNQSVPDDNGIVCKEHVVAIFKIKPKNNEKEITYVAGHSAADLL